MVASRDSAAAGGSTDVTSADAYVITSVSSTDNTFTITKSDTGFTRTCTSGGSTSGGCNSSAW